MYIVHMEKHDTDQIDDAAFLSGASKRCGYTSAVNAAVIEQTDVFRVAETGIRNDEAKGRSYATRGKAPVRKVNPVREKSNMMSAISNQDKVHFIFYKETMTAKLLIEFMERLIRNHERKMFFVLDNLRVLHNKILNEF